MFYPFEQRFIFAVENIDWHENAWLALITSNGIEPAPLVDILQQNGYAPDFVRNSITSLKLLDLERLVNLAMLPDYRSEPALAALKTRTSEDVFDKAEELSKSSSTVKRALAVKMLNSPYQTAFSHKTRALLKELENKEIDDLVIEQLGYAFSKLQIN